MSRYNKCEEDCKTKCNFDVGVKVETNPRAYACELERHPVEFPVDFNCKVNPHCTVKQVCPYKSEKGCSTGCRFVVDVDFDCQAQVNCGPCADGTAKYNVKVD